MSLDVTKDLLIHLGNDAAVIAAIDIYKSQPSIFTVVPEDVSGKYVALRQPHTVLDSSAKNGDLYSNEQFRDVLCVAPRTLSINDVEVIGNAVKRALHRATITASGTAVIEVIEALGPINADGENSFGRIVELRLTVRETS